MTGETTTRERNERKETEELKDLQPQKTTEQSTEQVRGGACASGQHLPEVKL
jgi:hypothetical protein